MISFCTKNTIQRMIMVVPARKLYQGDITHKTFIEKDFFETYSIKYKLKTSVSKYFPVNSKFIGDNLNYIELITVFDFV